MCSLGRLVSEGRAEPIRPAATLAELTLDDPEPDLADPTRWGKVTRSSSILP